MAVTIVPGGTTTVTEVVGTAVAVSVPGTAVVVPTVPVTVGLTEIGVPNTGGVGPVGGWPVHKPTLR